MPPQTIASHPEQPLSFEPRQQSARGDRLGVVLSVLCAIHCVATPFLLLATPVFGKIWSHPASHWLVAFFVIPLAVVMVFKGYKIHRRKWVIASGMAGIFLVLAGAAAPSVENAFKAQSSETSSLPASELVSAASEECADSKCETECAEETVESSEEASANVADSTCVDPCCPSIQAEEDGGWRLQIPLASVLTTLGGFFLIVTHIGNLRRCPIC